MKRTLTTRRPRNKREFDAMMVFYGTTGETHHGRANGKNRRTDGFGLLRYGNHQPTKKKAPQPA